MFRQRHGDAGDSLGFGVLFHGPRGPLHRHHFGRHFGRRHGRGTGRGNIKFEILAVIAEQPRHGYDVMLEIEKRRGGFRPSPGSIYPALQMLEEGGFIAGRDVDGKRVFEITESGRAALADHVERGGFDSDEDDDAARDLFISGAQSLRAVIEAAKQAARLGDPQILKATAEILDKARREIYKLLAGQE